MNYKIITDRKILVDFVYNFLPELLEGHKFYCSLFARSKYTKNSEIKADKAQLKRFISTKERLINKLEQLEIPLGTYKQFTKNKEAAAIPQESLAVYINPNPRDLKKATFNLGKKILELLQTDRNFNIHAESLSQIQQSSGKRIYMDFDFDNADLEHTIKKIKEMDFINLDACHILKTRGGFHILVKIDKVEEKYKKNWYNAIKSLEGVDIVGDNMIPIPGTFQGGFTPYLSKIQ